MKTRKTTFVAVLSQTLTTTSTFRTTSGSGAADGEAYDLRNGEGRALTTIKTPLPGLGQRWCIECATSMAMMAPEVAATVCFQSTREIYRLVEAGRVHFTDGPEGVMVCPASLMKDWAAEQCIPLLTSDPSTGSGCETKRP